jgi:hypothetical protein
MKISCHTLFDCSRTGVTGHYRSSEIPFVDKTGQSVNNQTDWNRSRNQQRNWETLLQIIGLRTQPQDITDPVHENNQWHFEFECEAEGIFEIHSSDDPLGGLKVDCDGVPMMLNLQEAPGLSPTILTSGSDQNIWFSTVNKALE